ncbi:MAG: flavin reductase family protein [Actinomycetota bacterium]|nr:flavin reductase family protein [Actinomycetota bacterium]
MEHSSEFFVNERRRRAGGAEFRELMTFFPSGVSIVTTLDLDGRPRGLTCTSLCSVSAAPPTILVCLNRASGSFAAVRSRGAFVVNLLSAEGRTAAEVFAGPGEDRFATVPWDHTAGLHLPWLTRHAHAFIECTVDRCIDAATHAVVIGRVNHMELTRQTPLLYGRRRFATWPEDGHA